jgi:hypothetical protein
MIIEFYQLRGIISVTYLRVPQILREYGVLNYSTELCHIIDNKHELAFGCEMETEIRAATIIAVDKMKYCFENHGHKILAIEIDWLLWQLGEQRKDEIAPHHRTLTIYY